MRWVLMGWVREDEICSGCKIKQSSNEAASKIASVSSKCDGQIKEEASKTKKKKKKMSGRNRFPFK